jgi:anti-sigma regulatory factor (Ser/Thr protein kinase)
LRDVQEFPPEPQAVVKVRRMVCRVTGVDDSHPAVLIASELATNAVVHTSNVFKVAIHANEVIRVEVTDDNPDPPKLNRSPLPTAGGGLGLRIVDEFSDQWGSEANDDEKTVWAEIPI